MTVRGGVELGGSVSNRVVFRHKLGKSYKKLVSATARARHGVPAPAAPPRDCDDRAPSAPPAVLPKSPASSR